MSAIDSNLPSFHLVPSRTSPTSESTVAHAQFGNPATPKYLKRRDPTATDTYTISLHDAFYPDIIYSAITTMAIYPQPSNTPPKPSKSKAAASASPAEPDPPKVPGQISINLFNPDSRIILTQKPSSWASGTYWEFSVPKTSFLQPTGSRLDVELDVAKKTLAILPVATFRWRKEGGVLSRSSLRCSLIHPNNVLLHDDGGGPSSSHEGKKSGSGVGGKGSSEPDITVALFTNGLNKTPGKGEITIYEPNLKRVEVEDVKGLEVALLMSAMTIADMYFGDMRVNFNLGARAPANFSGPGRTASISLHQQVELAQAQKQAEEDARRRYRAVSNPQSQHFPPRHGSFSAGGDASGGAPPPYAGGENGYPRDVKVRPTQEQLFSRDFQQRLIEEEERKREEAQRAREEAARREREAHQARLLAEQEAEARRLQRQFEEEEAREAAKIDAETRRLRAEYEREKAEVEGRRWSGAPAESPVQQPGSHYQRPPAVTVIPPHGHNAGIGASSHGALYPPQQHHFQQQPSSYPPQSSAKKSGWFGGKKLDETKDRRKSFLGLNMFGDSSGDGAGGAPPPRKDKGKGRLAKKKSGMW